MVTNQDKPEDPRPFGDDYSLQGRAVSREDRAAVQRQRDGLAPGRGQEAFSRRLMRTIQARRANRSDLVQFDLVRDERSSEVAVVHGQLLTRDGLPADAVAVLERAGYTGTVDPALEGVHVWDKPEARPDEVVDLARLLRRAGFQASGANVTPLGPFTKGEGGAEQTAATRRFPVVPAATEAEVRVAVVDTGIASSQRKDGWLEDLEVAGLNVDDLDAIPAADGLLDFAAGHGTFAAGIVQQVAPGASLQIYKAMDSDGIGSEVAVAKAVLKAADDGADIINLSLGGHTLDDQPLLAVEVALETVAARRRAAGKEPPLVVAAAGNYGSARPVFPAAQHGVVAVAGLDAELRATAWSTRGWWVHCSTVGEGILSTYVPGDESPDLDPEPDSWDPPSPWALWTGTSFAAPQVAGAVARLCGEDKELTTREALRGLMAGRPVPDHGRAFEVLPGAG